MTSINDQNIKAEITVTENCLNKGNIDVAIIDLKATIKTKIFPNVYKMLQVAFYFTF